MVSLVAVAQTLQNVDCHRQGWLADVDRLKTTSKCCVFFEVLAVFVESGRTDGLQFSASQQWLQDGCCIDGTLGCTRTNQGVNFVDEGDDVATGANFFGYLLEALFEVTAVTRAGDKRTHV